MSDQSIIMLVGLSMFFFKHFLFDFVFQTRFQLKNKGIYGHPGGILHAGLHAGGSIPAVLIFQPPSLQILLGLCLGEFIAHYHIDWCKERVVKGNGWHSENFGFWVALGFDQLLHALTYLALAAALIHFAPSAEFPLRLLPVF